MKASELIAALEAVIEQHGDLEVSYDDTYDGGLFCGGVMASKVDVVTSQGAMRKVLERPEILIT